MSDVELSRSSEEAVENHLIRLDSVVTEYLKGKTPTQIASELGMATKTVGTLLREWRDMAQNNDAIKGRAVIALHNADKHYDKLIHKAYGVLEDAEQAQSLSQRVATIKLIGDMESKRIDLLQKAGALEDTEMSAKIIETERKQAIVVDILKNTVGPCPRCRPMVQQKLAEMTNEVVVIKADE